MPHLKSVNPSIAVL